MKIETHVLARHLKWKVRKHILSRHKNKSIQWRRTGGFLEQIVLIFKVVTDLIFWSAGAGLKAAVTAEEKAIFLSLCRLQTSFSRWRLSFHDISCSIFGLCCRLFGFSVLFCLQAACSADLWSKNAAFVSSKPPKAIQRKHFPSRLL